MRIVAERAAGERFVSRLFFELGDEGVLAHYRLKRRRDILHTRPNPEAGDASPENPEGDLFGHSSSGTFEFHLNLT